MSQKPHKKHKLPTKHTYFDATEAGIHIYNISSVNFEKAQQIYKILGTKDESKDTEDRIIMNRAAIQPGPVWPTLMKMS
jgi:hypothetical protein